MKYYITLMIIVLCYITYYISPLDNMIYYYNYYVLVCGCNELDKWSNKFDNVY